jgi:hypothetical protein
LKDGQNGTGEAQAGDGPKQSTPKPPLNPYIVLLVSILLPGVGHVLNNQAKRGIIMLFFMISLAWVTYHLTTPQHSFLGRHAGGLFVYAMSIPDAYKRARYRWEYYRLHGRLPDGNAAT